MTTDKHGRCVHYLVFRKRTEWSVINGKLQRTVKWQFWRELDTIGGHVGAFVRQRNEFMQVRTIRH